MAVPLLDLKAQHATIRDSVLNAMAKVVDEQAFILGEPVERLERDVAQLSHTTHAIGVANGTDAILLALRALNVGNGEFSPTSIPTRSTFPRMPSRRS
jgi:dTDP-4-amino-4,6-dideoxygalactose transaminase